MHACTQRFEELLNSTRRWNWAEYIICIPIWHSLALLNKNQGIRSLEAYSFSFVHSQYIWKLLLLVLSFLRHVILYVALTDLFFGMFCKETPEAMIRSGLNLDPSLALDSKLFCTGGDQSFEKLVRIKT
ncbi:hypothetical protein MPTK1_2g24190 [Marchantia polymorpha subsp. ruderalis]|uniref:Uncharacterized protein n=1 Tax=Marchantia polymorpha TaxID=3197 RepID=A0A2R6WPF6_MARPO|nr:hypothetical protein MARPO_0069s0068 [Marchantia polymorpha]BBN03525.1 hypothetical protein Mp_2g24190 [Marchantia polymorpha subsp. ruderalis]|eukprot:PTQ35731.1 hypothetical protein MARPO_0069s0068 [Marchantia polymorpha]